MLLTTKITRKLVWLFRLMAQRVSERIYIVKIRSYRWWWNDLAKKNAVGEILSTATNETDFDQTGRDDAEWLHSVFGSNRLVLDVGCGIGRIERFLAPYCRELHAVDISSVMLKKASKRLADVTNVQLRKVNGKDLSFYRDATFDALFCLLVLHHLEYEDAFGYLLEFNRILKMGGLCVLQFPDFCSERYFSAFLRHVPVEARFRPYARSRGYTSEQIRFELSKAGFDIQDLRRSGYEFIVLSKKLQNPVAAQRVD